MRKRIAVLIGPLFEESEYLRPADAFRSQGHTLVHVGRKREERVTGKQGKDVVQIDRAAKDVSPDDFDALMIPGGYSPDKLRVDEGVVDFVRAFVKSNKPVFSICHAPQLLITAHVLHGRKITGYKSIMQDIINAGAEYVDKAVVIDDNIISSRDPQDLPAFIDASLSRLEH